MNHGRRREPTDEKEREHIRKLIREGLSNTVIGERTGRSHRLLQNIRLEMEAKGEN